MNVTIEKLSKYIKKIETLTEREADILASRVEGVSLANIGSRYNVGGEQVRRIELEAVKKLQNVFDLYKPVYGICHSCGEYIYSKGYMTVEFYSSVSSKNPLSTVLICNSCQEG